MNNNPSNDPDPYRQHPASADLAVSRLMELGGFTALHKRFDELEVKLANTVQLAEVIARLFESDPHSYSTRPCETCRNISRLLGRSFGCDAK